MKLSEDGIQNRPLGEDKQTGMDEFKWPLIKLETNISKIISYFLHFQILRHSKYIAN